MSIICPVCQKPTKTKCNNCGFKRPAFGFLSKTDSNKWYKDTVLPHREKWKVKNLKRKHSVKTQKWISVSSNDIVCLKTDGTIVETKTGPFTFGVGNILKWRDITSVYTTENSIVGLKTDGTVVAISKFHFLWHSNPIYGHSHDTMFDGTFGNKLQCNTQDWRDIIDISASDYHTVGLKSNGIVVATGDNQYGQCNTQDWRDIINIFAIGSHTVGLKSDGTVVAVGYNSDSGQWNTQNWQDIIDIFVSHNLIVGLKSNGTVVVGGGYNGEYNTQKWRDIIDISVSSSHIVGLKSDGTVVAIGDNYDEAECNTQDWRDIINILAGYRYTIGLKTDGTVVAIGRNQYG